MLLKTDVAACHLRPWRTADKPSLIRYANNIKIWRNLKDVFPHPYTEKDADAWLAIAGREGPSIHLAIEFQRDAIGGIGVVPLEGNARRTGHFGYWLAEMHWGRGIATAAARAMVSHVFSRTRLARLEAPVFAWNPASMRVLEKTGFLREGVHRRSVFKDGQLIDSVMYALVRDEA